MKPAANHPSAMSTQVDDVEAAIARLLGAAREDATLRSQLLFLVKSPALQRESMVNTALHEMELRGEPADVRAAFAVLATEGGSQAVQAVLGAKPELGSA